MQGRPTPLDVLVQVNTSAEETKSGCAPDAAAGLCQAIVSSCPALRLRGLMCIGKYSAEEGDACGDFECLARCRGAAATALGLSEAELALSMGMSHDFEAAITAGATHVCPTRMHPLPREPAKRGPVVTIHTCHAGTRRVHNLWGEAVQKQGVNESAAALILHALQSRLDHHPH